MTKQDTITIVKAGSNALVDDNGQIRQQVMADILQSITETVKKGLKVILVTSGATKLGRKILNQPSADVRIAAAVGQLELFANYQTIGKRLNATLAELLISRPHLVKRNQFLAFQKMIEDFFAAGIVPIVNENDGLIAGTDWSFGDNDSVAAALAIALKANKLIILSHVDGLFDRDPLNNISASLISEVTDVNKELMKYCSDNISAGGRGGMMTKLKAIRLCTAVGIESFIVNGLKKDNLNRALLGERVGTYFKPRSLVKKISNRDRWLMAAKNSTGSLEVDQGAVEALRRGKSLL